MTDRSAAAAPVVPSAGMVALARQVVAAGRDIKLAHSVFALPFALVGAFYAARGLPRPGQLALILAAMFFARTFAMLANRYLDRDVDAANPRTAGRALPAGRMSPAFARAALAVSGLALVAVAGAFWAAYHNPWPLALAPVVLAWLFAYSLAKRVTAMCHFMLGAALAMSPLAAALAVEPAAAGEAPPWLLAGFVLLWVAGFDIIYAVQDIDFDRGAGLQSIPARLGEQRALMVAKVAHFAGLSLLVVLFRTTPMFYHAAYELTMWGLVGVAVLLMVEHRAAARRQFSVAFFTVNGVVALGLGAAMIGDILLG